MILDPTSDQAKVKSTLEKLAQQMEDLQKTAFTYKSYQKNFKVEVTKYEELEEVFAELKMKQQLWGSIDDWDALVKGWMEVNSAAIRLKILVIYITLSFI